MGAGGARGGVAGRRGGGGGGRRLSRARPPRRTSARARGDQEPRRTVLRGRRPDSRAHTPRAPSHVGVPPAGPGAPRGLLMVPAPVAVGGERPVVRLAARRGARAWGRGRRGVGREQLARARARAGLDPRRAVGSLTLSYPCRGDVSEGPR